MRRLQGGLSLSRGRWVRLSLLPFLASSLFPPCQPDAVKEERGNSMGRALLTRLDRRAQARSSRVCGTGSGSGEQVLDPECQGHNTEGSEGDVGYVYYLLLILIAHCPRNPANLAILSTGTSWSYLNNYIMGVSEGHTAILRLVGVGYRATVEERGGKKAQFPGQKFLCLKLGFTHPVEEPIPVGIKVTTPQPTRILVEGVDKEMIMSFAGRVRKWRPPEPYKGKGVFINDQTIK